MIEKDVIKKFIDSPYNITFFETYYKQYVAYLHLLLVRHGEKKCFVFFTDRVSFDPLLKICKQLKFKNSDWKQVNTYSIDKIPRTTKMDKEMAECIVKVGKTDFNVVICSMDRASLVEMVGSDHEKIGEIEQYPDCCVDAFIEHRWKKYEIVVSALGKPVAQSRTPTPDYEETVRKWADSVGVPVKLATDADFVVNGGKLVKMGMIEGAENLVRQISQDMAENYEKGREIAVNTVRKYPFVSHRACEGCLRDVENSPTAIMNKRYSGFCKREYPELHEGIITEAKNAANDAAEGSMLQFLGHAEPNTTL